MDVDVGEEGLFTWHPVDRGHLMLLGPRFQAETCAPKPEDRLMIG